jgi:soluble lytic murein transglycosylase-like protein
MTSHCAWCRHLRTVFADVGQGLFIITHNGLALVGWLAASLVLAFVLRPDVWELAELEAVQWLRERQVLLAWLPQNTTWRVTAMELRELPASQAAVAQWLSQKYRVAPEPLAALVAEAHVLSAQHQLPAHLILAVAAIESSFHPYVQSRAGAQGLMQVMTGIHAYRYDAHGGKLAAFDPVANLKVGVELLAEYIHRKGGTREEGLRFYLGGAGLTEDGGYVAKVLAEQQRLDQVAAGKSVPLQ